MSAFNLTVAQFGATIDPTANLENALQLVSEAAAQGADLVVLPENAMYSDPLKERPGEKYSEPLDGTFVTSLKKSAKEHGVHVLAGFTETTDGDRPYNTLVHLTPEGELENVYRKVHLYDAFGYKESDTVCPAAAEALVFEVNGVKVGAATCYDLRFPEISRFLVDHGAEAIVLPAAWVVGPLKEYHWETLIRARAIENTVYFAGCGQTGPDCTGSSMIVDPMGVTIAAAGEAPMALASARIDTDRIGKVRASNPSLSNRRFSVSPLPAN